LRTKIRGTVRNKHDPIYNWHHQFTRPPWIYGEGREWGEMERKNTKRGKTVKGEGKGVTSV